MNEMKTLQRDITLSKLLRTQSEVEFHSTHALIHGIYDDKKLEGFTICKDWESIDGLNRLVERLSFLDLRCRFNMHRGSKSFIRWISNENLEKLDYLYNNGDNTEAKSLIINDSISI